MLLEAGHCLRHYRIVEPIGAGGMGEVYRARDTNLDRDVAIKVLPREVADNPQSLARLEREAKAIAALSHPNILAVHDFGTERGVAFVVTELLRGETLRERLAQGALAPRKAAELGRQIARGLAAAHDKGIVHRDLKPENLFLTEEGRVKILDFGLAAESGAAPAGAPGADAAGNDATRTSLTAPGTVLGTVDYMSPEQVRGEPVDRRSDIFSFGSVLHEMLAGARPFRRDTQAETMTAVLREDPAELSASGSVAPPALEKIVRRCLEKRPGERFQSAHDLAFSLEAMSDVALSSGSAAAVVGVPEPRSRRWAAPLAGALAIGLTIGATVVWLLHPQPDRPPPPWFATISSRRGTVTNARFTGGGDTSLVYSATWDGRPLQLFPASRQVLTADPFDIEGADLLSVSRRSGEMALALDRRYPVGWEAIGTLAVAQQGGGAPRRLLENVLVADWGPDGELAVAHEVEGIVRLEYPVGTVLYESPGWISELRVHPRGERILIGDNRIRGDNVSTLKIVHRDGRVESLGLGGSWGAVWAPDGESVLASGGATIRRFRLGEESVRIHQAPVSLRLLDVDTDGRLLVGVTLSSREMIVRAPGARAESNISWLDWSTPRLLSDDGRWVVFEEGNDATREGYGIYMRDTGSGGPLRLGYGTAVALSPDARWLAAVVAPFSDEPRLMLMPTGPGEPVPVETGGVRPNSESGTWLPGEGPDDRGTLIFSGRDAEGVIRLYDLPLTGSASPRPLTPPDLPLTAIGHAVSPDGRRVVVRPVEGPALACDRDGGAPRPVPGIAPGDLPLRFDRDGKHLFVALGSRVPTPIVRIDLASGEREPWLELSPVDPAGVFVVDRIHLSDDGRAYVYSDRKALSNVAVMGGLE
jgi:serine/threonine protein kinase